MSKTPSAYILTGLPTGGGFVLYPTGWTISPIGGGAMETVFSFSADGSWSFEMLFRPFRPMRFAISVLPSVVSDGSPGSSALSFPLGIFSWVPDRNRFAGGLVESIEFVFLWFKLADSGAVDSPSSPDASRDDGCNWSIAGVVLFDGNVFVLFRLPAFEPAKEGEDMVTFYRCCSKDSRVWLGGNIRWSLSRKGGDDALWRNGLDWRCVGQRNWQLLIQNYLARINCRGRSTLIRP